MSVQWTSKPTFSNLYDEDTDDPFLEMLQSAIDSARTRRADFEARLMLPNEERPEFGTYEEGHRLRAACQKNVMELAEELYERDCKDMQFIWGGLYYDDDDPPTSLIEAEMRGCIHMWIEIPHPTCAEVIIPEIVSEASGHVGLPAIFRTDPPNYLEFPKSRYEYHPTMRDDDLFASKREDFERLYR